MLFYLSAGANADDTVIPTIPAGVVEDGGGAFDDLVLDPAGHYLYVASAGDERVGPSTVSIYKVHGDGSLTARPTVVIPDQGAYRLAIVNLTAP